MPDNSFLLFTLGPVQSFIKAARTVRDLWSGSYLFSYLTFRALQAVASGNANAIVFPDVAKLPLWKWEQAGRRKPAPLEVLEPCIPNRFLAEVPRDDAGRLAKAAEDACRAAWKEIAGSVKKFLEDHTPRGSLDPHDLWDLQIEQCFEIYTAVLPQDEYDAAKIKHLLGVTSANEWSNRHQIAQKMLAAVKNRRHFPVYAPPINGDVPQKDTLLGTLEHLGPGNRRDANEFWKKAATEWHSHGSKVTRREKLCAVSLVKRFAWAHHFADAFGYEDRRVLKFQDSPTIAAEMWLRDERAPDPRNFVRDDRNELWSGLWPHWSSPLRPHDDPDEDDVPDAVWDAIKTKKAKQGKPPTYYAVLVFDGDRMGERFNAATSPDQYRKISGTLAAFAVKPIRDIVKKHHGELIYAGGDDAICALPTETAVACAKDINTAFTENWRAAFPTVEPATISGGLVIAHYKEDLRFVMERAHDAEKASKAAGRDRLTITVCRRSGEYTSATVPWKFVPTVIDWVNGFRAGASDRWVYKLRADLSVFENDLAMFELELARQLNRSEENTRKHFSLSELRAAFSQHPSVENFVTLLQTASFLTRGRDA